MSCFTFFYLKTMINKIFHHSSGHEGKIWGCCWSPDCTLLATCGEDKIIRIWNFHSNSLILLQELEGPHTKSIRSVSFSPNGHFLASASFDGIVSIWSKNHRGEWNCVADLTGHENEVKSVSWNCSGKLLATCGRDKTVWVWELNPGMDDDETFMTDTGDVDFECAAVLGEHIQDVKGVLFHPLDSLLLASCSYDDSIKIWQTPPGDNDDWKLNYSINDHSSTVWSIDFSSDGKYMLSCSDDLSIGLYEKLEKKYQKVSTLSWAHTRSIYKIIFLDQPHSLETEDENKNELCFRFFATISGDRTLCVWRIDMNDNSIKKIDVFETEERTILHCIDWNYQHNIIALVGDDGMLMVLKIENN